MCKSDSGDWGLSSWNCGPRALTGVSAPSGGPSPHAVAASDEERRATVERGDCNCKHSARPEARGSSVSSIIMARAPYLKSARPGWYQW